MKTFQLLAICLALLFVPTCFAQVTAQALDIRRAVPLEAHVAVYGRHNPERDFQREHATKVLQRIQSEKLCERILSIITSRMPAEDLEDARLAIAELQEAIDPELGAMLLDSEEMVYAQVMEFPISQHLVLFRYPTATTDKLVASCQNLLALLEKKSTGKVPVTRLSQGEVEITGLGFPPEVPFQPAFARVGDVFLISSSQQLISQSIEMLQNTSGVSKFNEPKFVDALKHLPEPEDALVIFDAQRLFNQFRKMGDMIQAEAKTNPDAEKISGVIDLLFEELAVIDYEVTVGYTEGHENRTTSLGKYTQNAETKLLGKLSLGGEPFENWQNWIPADAVAYSLSTGVRLHEAYDHAMNLIKTRFPEAQEGLDKFEAMQQQVDFHLDRDILQSFSGENVSLSLPREDKGQDSVVALKCTNPERIKALLHRAVDSLNTIPAIATQQVKLVEAENLPGFEMLNVAMLAAFDIKPVIGFADGWMLMGSNTACVQKVLDARAGKIPTIAGSEHFERFHLSVNGPVKSLRYTDVESTIHYVSGLIRKAGAVAPMFLATAGAQANPEDLKPLQEVLALLPSIANVVDEFDFYQANLGVVRDGPLPNSYLKESVTLVRAAEVASKP